jgi:hypothetical protein
MLNSTSHATDELNYWSQTRQLSAKFVDFRKSLI